MNEQQGKEKNTELYKQAKGQELNNPMINSRDTKDLSALLSHNPSPFIKDLLRQTSYRKIWLGIEKGYRVFFVNDETVAKFSDM